MRYGELSFFQTGVAVPLFSLRSKNSIGIGEFLDLIPFASWAKYCDLNVIQILPINDTGNESSPYSARSAFALHPVYINLQLVNGSSDFEEEIEMAKKDFDKDTSIDFHKVVTWKLSVLRKIFDTRYNQIATQKKIESWINVNEWVKPYCVYALLKAKHQEASWKEWKTNQSPTPESIEKIWRKHPKEAMFQAWLQFIAEAQFKVAVNALSEMDVKLKGDIPILINEDSADVWFHREYFSLDDRAGAPPDMFSYSGQNWGFPTYHWDALEKDNYSWWRKRLIQASKFYHAYRIDHVLGFFRIWTIPESEVTGILGRFSPSFPLKRSDLERKGIKKESLDYLRDPNFSVEQLKSFFGKMLNDDILEEFFEELSSNPNRFVLKEPFHSEKAILASLVSQDIKDTLLKVYWNRVFVPAGTEEDYYPYWYWYEQPVLFTLPESEQQILRNAISENAAAQESLWQDNALKLLNVLANETDMLVCAEDLGAVPRCVPYVLNKLNILALRVERWTRNWDAPYSPYYEMEDYPRLSVCTTSSHDTSTLRGLWDESDFDRELFWQHAHQQGMPPDNLYPNHIKGLLANIFTSNSLFCIIPLQDFFGLSSQFSMVKPDLERINIPGTVGPHNWSYRIPTLVEDLANASALNSEIRALVDVRKRQPIWKI